MELSTPTFTISALIKNVSYIAAAFVALGPDAYTILGIFMMIDTFTGVIKSGTIRGWGSVTSHSLTLGVLSKATIILVPLLITIAGHGVGFDLVFLGKSTLNILIISELYSILSNIQSIRLKKEVQEFDAINFLLSKLRDILEKTIKKDPKK